MAPAVAVGIDVGGTKTELRVESNPGRRLHHALLATADWWRPGTRINDPANVAALGRHLPSVELGTAAALVLGAHGIDSDIALEDMRTQLQRHFPGYVRVVNDAVLAGPAAGYPCSSLAVIAGTGSIVVSVDAAGTVTRVGGHGHLLGDEGSAPALVRDVARGLLDARDANHPDAIALSALADAAGVPACEDRAAELSTSLHADPSHTTWGSLAPAVFAAADAGSPIAAAVVADHAHKLSNLACLLVRRCGLPEAVVLAGGVATHQPRLATAVAAGIHHQFPHLPVVVLDTPPVMGAVLLALTALSEGRYPGDAAAAASDVTTAHPGVEGTQQ